jgi:hypothetical protein
VRFAVRAQRITDDAAWEIQVTPWAPGAEPISRRIVACPSGSIFPRPPQAEVDALDGSEPHADLCRAADARLIEQAFIDIAARDPGPRTIQSFGAYLFAVLLGEQAWRAICERAGDEPVELALMGASSDWELTRLPWEMMCGPNGFLAVEPRRHVAITRLVSSTRPTPASLVLEPRALFVVGADLADVAIRPGAEYLGLLRRLQAQGLSLNCRILVRATTVRLQDAIERFKPSIVHFICHGGITDDHRGYLKLVSNDDPRQDAEVSGGSLLPILLQAHQPPVVVLNACYAGTPPPDRFAAPLAVELIKGGIPLAVGMAGRVADRACRLFTRRFYEALLQGDSVVAAAAEGRRAGIEHGTDPQKNADWAFPALFLAESIPPEISLDDATRDRWTNVETRALRYLTQLTPPFCDRLELREEAYQELMSPPGRPVARVLAVEVEAADKGTEAPRYGKTRLLEELAAQAVRDGHVPCLLAYYNELPGNGETLAKALLQGIIQTRQRFGLPKLPLAGYEVFKLRQRLRDPTSQEPLHVDVQQEIEMQTPSPGGGFVLDAPVLRAAVRIDLQSLAVEARQALGLSDDARVLVLIDDVERFDKATRALKELLDQDGLGTPSDPVPVVFAFSGGVTSGELGSALQELRDFLERHNRYVKHVRIQPFRSPADDPLPYMQFLLGQQPPLILQKEDVPPTDVLDLLHDKTGGAPSRFEHENVRTVLDTLTRIRYLTAADDDAVLQGVRGI